MSATIGGTDRHITYVLRSNPITAVAAAGAAILVLIAIPAPWIVPYDPIASDVQQALQRPSAAHWAGTDQFGRDIFSRIISATRLDLVIAISAVGLSFAAGAVVGGFCGYSGGRLDRWVGRVVDALMARAPAVRACRTICSTVFRTSSPAAKRPASASRAPLRPGRAY